MNAIYKSFGGVPALSEASLEVMPAEVMAIVGQNGAGKSTMIKIINGHYVRDSGSISFNGAPWTAGSPQQAQRAGISTIFQEINLIGYRSVAENIFLGREPKRAFGLLDWARMNAEAAALLARFDFLRQAALRLVEVDIQHEGIQHQPACQQKQRDIQADRDDQPTPPAPIAVCRLTG